MAIKINGNEVVDNNRKGIFQSANVGAFSNPTRPGSAATGDIIYSTTDSKLQVWNGSAWVAAGGGAEISATGGTKTTSADGFYFLHTFTSPGTFTLSTNGAVIDYFLIGGGGGGGNGRTNPQYTPQGNGGGGGAGGHILEYARVWASGSYSVSIGGGGNTGGYYQSFYSLAGTNGSDTTLQCPPSISAPGTLTALGGGGGGGGSNIPPNVPGVVSRARPGGCGGGSGQAGSSNSLYSGAAPSDPNQGGAGNTFWGYQTGYSPFQQIPAGGGGISCRGNYGGVPTNSGGFYYAGAWNSAFGVDGMYLKWASPTRAYYGGGGNGRGTAPGYYAPVTGNTPALGTGAANTGGGGHGQNHTTYGPAPSAGNGNSGIVIIRYAKVQNL